MPEGKQQRLCKCKSIRWRHSTAGSAAQALAQLEMPDVPSMQAFQACRHTNEQFGRACAASLLGITALQGLPGGYMSRKAKRVADALSLSGRFSSQMSTWALQWNMPQAVTCSSM